MKKKRKFVPAAAKKKRTALATIPATAVAKTAGTNIITTTATAVAKTAATTTVQTDPPIIPISLIIRILPIKKEVIPWITK